MSGTILSVKDLVKVYPNGVRALKGVSFDVKQGEFLVVIGLSGSGKSTLLRCLNRLHDSTSGRIFFQGRDITLFGPSAVKKLRTQIAMIFQHFNLISRHSVIANVLMGRLGSTGVWASILGLFSRTDRANAMKYLQLVGIAEKARIRADQLSGGQQQRVAIARALAQEPLMLLADEPVASLDPVTSHSILDYLQKINREMGVTIICNLHFLSLVRQYATRVIALKDGNIVFEGRPEHITNEWFKKIYGEEARDVSIH